jgi:hypothetical protein
MDSLLFGAQRQKARQILRLMVGSHYTIDLLVKNRRERLMSLKTTESGTFDNVPHDAQLRGALLKFSAENAHVSKTEKLVVLHLEAAKWLQRVGEILPNHNFNSSQIRAMQKVVTFLYPATPFENANLEHILFTLSSCVSATTGEKVIEITADSPNFGINSENLEVRCLVFDDIRNGVFSDAFLNLVACVNGETEWYDTYVTERQIHEFDVLC